ncbi:acyl-CoA dehydrogenase family protein [Actinomadura bangladeshensis]|uniref:Acyl-CoA dehydrogenase n=1 Tax=Actinomadura bangladeshensis TaxID=453573 RepID=A0A6L9QFM0_9ACTN|nr:acyl-CoA dehydrogenase family protein [Actinomadura bangladeshensis]NEA23786.1 acyl-CoA dehydrogenase [Actinomadura bangladeshensis]
MESVFETDDHKILREKVRDFAESEIAPRVACMEATQTVDVETSTLIARQGWLGVTIPREYGGMGAGHLAKTIVIEELARVSGAMGAMVQASQLGAAKILHYGTEEQKQRWLPPIAAGSCLPTIAVTEDGSGGNVLDMQAGARRDGGEWVLNGRKFYVGNSHVGHVHGVIVRTGDDRTRRSKSLSAFLVEHDRPGLTLLPYKPPLGLHGFSFGDLVMDNVRVPADNMIGGEGDGLDVAYSSSVLYGRPNLTAVALGIHQALLEETVRFAKDRHRRDEPLAMLPTIEQRIGRINERLMTARTLAYQAVHMLDLGQPCDDELISAKYRGVESLIESALDAMKIHAAAGLRRDRPLERLVRDAFHIDAPAGTGDIQLHRLAESALGTGKGQWSHRLAHVTALHSAPDRPTSTAGHAA